MRAFRWGRDPVVWVKPRQARGSLETEIVLGFHAVACLRCGGARGRGRTETAGATGPAASSQRRGWTGLSLTARWNGTLPVPGRAGTQVLAGKAGLPAP